ncbi:MAG: transglycosylase SLT domain-containing protein [Chloroflexi bacterium]|nr:transglycosylase SLT domain-containing protein [Chloroflexota bacterium]
MTLADIASNPLVPAPSAAPALAATALAEPALDPLDDVALAAEGSMLTRERVPVSGVALQVAPSAGPLDAGEAARRLGDFPRATAIYRDLAGSSDPGVANEALLQLAVVQVEAGTASAAADTARELLGRSLDPAARARALFVLGRAQRFTGDCSAALATFDKVQAQTGDFGPYVDLQAAYCLAAADDRAGQNDRAGKALTLASARLTKIDALEHQLSALQKPGDRTGALAVARQLLDLAGTRTYRAQTLGNIGDLSLQLERRDEAISAFATLVAEHPESPAAGRALTALRDLGAAANVGPEDVGVVQYFQGRATDAVATLTSALDRGLPSPERTARARFYLGQALFKLDRVDDGVAVLQQVANDLPGSEQAAQALLRAGRRLESDGRYVAASDAYALAAAALPSSAASQEAAAQLVFALTMRGAAPEAVAAARSLADGPAGEKWKGLGLLWASRALAGVGDPAQEAAVLAQAADLDRAGFGGLRARDILDGGARPRQQSTTLDPAVLQVSADDAAQLEGWLGGFGLSVAALDAEQANEPAYQRAALLYRVGLAEWAGWEVQDLATRYASDPARLYWLARFASERGATTLGMRTAMAAQKAAGAPVAGLPRMVQRLIYPLPYADTLVTQATRRNVDPLLLAGLIRQESAFDPKAKSSAGALGLGQVMPATGQGIARALGRAGFSTEELLLPGVGIEFGAYYLSNQLGAYQGQVYPALAAYNAGGGNVNQWLRDYSTDDMDVFAERIPFAETSAYVHIVYENYLNYRRLYR